MWTSACTEHRDIQVVCALCSVRYFLYALQLKMVSIDDIAVLCFWGDRHV
jgi:hypothetical protein